METQKIRHNENTVAISVNYNDIKLFTDCIHIELIKWDDLYFSGVNESLRLIIIPNTKTQKIRFHLFMQFERHE